MASRSPGSNAPDTLVYATLWGLAAAAAFLALLLVYVYLATALTMGVVA